MAARPVTQADAATWLDRARWALAAGDRDSASALLNEGCALNESDAAMQHGAGNLFLKLGDADRAAACFDRASTLAPGNIEWATDHGIALSSADRNVEALAVFRRIETAASHRAIYCSARANAARKAGDTVQAHRWYDAALAIEPRRQRALHGRARVAVERGEDDAAAWFDRALRVNRGDADLWLGKAQALDVAGDIAGARQIAESLVEQAPSWAQALKFLAQLRSDAGEGDFDSHYDRAATRAPQDPNIPAAHCALLAGIGRDAEAADIAAHAHRRFPDMHHFAFLEAAHASTAGQLERASGLFRTLTLDTPDRWLHEARHCIRQEAPQRADAQLARVLAADPWNISAWALRGVAWRMSGDRRAQWLHGDNAMTALLPLQDAQDVLSDVAPLLHRLHDRSPFPLGQSLRGGTQTRGNLFDRDEPALERLRSAIMSTLETYRQTLPPEDARHPFLRNRDKGWTMAGSWSVRLTGGSEHHAAHIHPQGTLSSALYVAVPPGTGEEGWLEIGRPAADLRTGLGPLATFQPKEGHVALFPSIMYHGTRPFAAGQRMTVAFDIQTIRT